MNLKVNELYVKSKFMDGLYEYICNFFQSKNGVIYRPKADYIIPNEDYVIEHWTEIHEEICLQKPLYEFSEELKVIAVQYLPVFLSEHPECQGAECLKTK